MEQTYDAIVLGTGLKECIISGILSVNGYKVLHMDRNDYYGGESASFNLEQLYEKFKEGEKPPAKYGRTRDWYVDLIPKFIMGKGLLVDVLRHTDVSKYLDFRRVDGSFVIHGKTGGIHKVPTTTSEALSSKLVKLSQKNHMRSFLNYIASLDKTEKPHNLDVLTMRQLFDAFKIDESCSKFIGHAMGLYLNDDYLEKPAREACERIRVYCMSMFTFERSPYIYPEFGLGELPQAFSRLSAVWGGTYMLRMNIDEILYHDDGKVAGIRSGEEKAYCKWLVMDPTYFPDMAVSVGQVRRSICILKGPLAECVEQSKIKASPNIPTSAQIILTSDIHGRKNDIYVTTQGPGHKTTPSSLDKPYCLGFVSTMAEKTLEEDLAPGIEILQRAEIEECFKFSTEILHPKPGFTERGIFISESYDATSHFQTTVEDVLKIYNAIVGHPIDLKAPPRKPAEFNAEQWEREEAEKAAAAGAATTAPAE